MSVIVPSVLAALAAIPLCIMLGQSIRDHRNVLRSSRTR